MLIEFYFQATVIVEIYGEGISVQNAVYTNSTIEVLT